MPLADGRVALLLSEYRWRADAPPELLRTAALLGDSVHSGVTVAAALGLGDSPAGTAPADPTGDAAARAAAIYDRMRDAMRRGDWRAFGEAFDALGAALGRPPR